VNNGDLKTQVQPILTLDNARKWFRETEKVTFVTGLLHDTGIRKLLLDYSPKFSRADSVSRYVQLIEREFDRILIAAGE